MTIAAGGMAADAGGTNCSWSISGGLGIKPSAGTRAAGAAAAAAAGD